MPSEASLATACVGVLLLRRLLQQGDGVVPGLLPGQPGGGKVVRRRYRPPSRPRRPPSAAPSAPGRDDQGRLPQNFGAGLLAAAARLHPPGAEYFQFSAAAAHTSTAMVATTAFRFQSSLSWVSSSSR